MITCLLVSVLGLFTGLVGGVMYFYAKEMADLGGTTMIVSVVLAGIYTMAIFKAFGKIPAIVYCILLVVGTAIGLLGILSQYLKHPGIS